MSFSRRLQHAASYTPLPPPEVYQQSLTLWLKADAITSLNDGDPVALWSDSSPMGNDATQATQNQMPIFHQAILNGLPVITFNGSNRLLSAAPAGDGEQTVITVLRPTNVSGVGVFRGSTGGALGCRIENNFLQVLATNVASIGYSSTPLAANQWIIVTVTFSDSGNTATFRVNQGDAGTIAATNSVVAGSTLIGDRPEGSEGFQGDVAEILTYNAVLTPEQIRDTEAALAAKYNIVSTPITVPEWPAGLTPVMTLNEEFNPPWTNWPFSPDGNWRVAGGWVGTGGNWLDPANATITDTYNSQSGGYLTLISRANTYSGGEIQTQGDTGGPKFGYYETRMLVSPTPGVCDSFFWIGANYVGGEIDVEFLTDESWIATPDQGIVHFSVHNATNTLTAHRAHQLNFNPSLDFHRYGWLWLPDLLAFTVDGAVAWILPNSFDMGNVASSGYIMANTWTGQVGWGGGPPLTDAATVYDWMRYYADAPAIPPQ